MNRRLRSGVRWALLIMLYVAATGGLQTAVAESQAPDSGDVSITGLRHEITTIKSRKDLPEGARKHALDRYEKALAALQSARHDREQTAELRKKAAEAPQAVNRLQHELSDLAEPVGMDELNNRSLSQLSNRAADLRSNLSDAQAHLTSLRDQLTRLAQRPEEVRQALSDARANLQELSTRDAQPSADSGIVTQAKRTWRSAQRLALNSQIERLQQELTSVDSRERRLEAERSLAEARVARYNDSLAAVESALGREQDVSARKLKQASEDKLSELRTTASPITQAAQRNVELTHRLSKISADAQTLGSRQSSERRRVQDLKRRFNLVQRQLEIGGGSIALGDVLRHQRRRLADPVLPFLSSSAANDVPDVAAAELQRFQLQQDRPDLDNPEPLARRMARKAGVSLDPGQQQSLVGLLRQRRSIIDQLIDAESRYVNIGRDLQSLSKQYNETLSSFNRLLDERLFWLPSFRTIGLDWPARVGKELPWLVNPAGWRDTAVSFVEGIRAMPFVAGFGVLVIGLLLAMRGWLCRSLQRLGEPVGNVSHDTFWLTLRAVAITGLLSLPSVLICLLIGYLTRHAPDASRFAEAVAAAVFQLGLVFLFIEPFVHVCRAYGLADRHFQWPGNARHGLHRNLRWLLAALIVPVMVITLTEVFDDDNKRDTLGRAAFVLGQLWIAIFAWRVLHPTRGVLADVLTDDSKDTWRLGYLWLPVAGGSAIGLAGLAVLGYYYTAVQMQTRFFYSGAWLAGCMIGYSLIVRWLTVAERRLALTRALQKREEAREARAAREAAAASGEGAPDNLDAAEIDLVQINEQTRGLIKMVIALAIGAGLWLVWSGTLPALQLLDNIDLWQYASEANGRTEITNVTLGAVLLSLAVGVGTALAGRNLPGFLEITILRRFSMDAGSRYAMATLFQYAIVIFGLLVAAALIGLRWSSIQWLVAAVGVGLGFGLQEIFANFVSGIVILFERPVRVGDTVTVGTLTGTVSRIRIRATTVTDWDNKEVVIPNKTFITETVINWTLSDDITRLIIEVGVALDSDGELVERLILEAIQAEPVALENPAPSVFTVGYGDSAILYEARVFYHDLYYLLPLQHAIYRRIHKAFTEHGIRIVFPQHDLHLRSVDESVGKLLQKSGKESDHPASDGDNAVD